MLLWVAVGVLGFGVLCVLYGVLVEHHWFRLTRYRLPILPGGAAAPLTMLHLSDLHFTSRDRRKARFLAGLPQADVTVVTGDILGEAEAVEPVVEALRGVRGRVGSFFVLGSNDYFQPRPQNYLRYFFQGRSRRRKVVHSRSADLEKALVSDGWVHLKNVRRDVMLDGTSVELVGMDDPHIHRSDLRVAPRVSPERFGLAVVHSPDPAPELAALGYDLIVAGHTHGGQVRLPLVGALVTNSHMPRALAMGLVRIGDAYMHVSPGMGTSKYAPFRFLCRPEATVLELRPKVSAPQPMSARSKARS
jgi:predicted MPP superfamily phosphohydrolase